MSEHRVIEQVLACLESMANRCLTDRVLNGPAAHQAVDFLQTFVDRCHHAKEENHLFPLLEARGLARARGPTGVLLYEHDVGRRLLPVIAIAIDRATAGNTDALRQFAGHALAYVALLRQHIAKEDQRLFPLADQRLTEDDQAALQEAFADAESSDLYLGLYDKYLDIANDLADHFDVPRTSQGAVVVPGCCSCGPHG
jgi:hemerythrin-like domain-containing protein